jgi:ArsR family transcriptional regulator
MSLSMLDEVDDAIAPPNDFNAAIRAIAHPIRRKILEWLKDPQLYFPDQEYGQELGVCIGQIVRRCEKSPSTVSSHLTLLKSAGLIELNKVGTVHFLRRNDAALEQFKATLIAELRL